MILPTSASEEWRKYWPLPLTAALGYSTAVLHTYSLGPFIAPLQNEFGWSRAAISGGLTIAGLAGAALSIPVGMMVDRLGPRVVGLTGAILMPASIALLGTATGSLTNWYALWAFVAFADLWMLSTVWASAVASRFDASRGLAFAVTMSGGSITSTILPVIATALIVALGWRSAFASIGAIWVLAVFPLLFLFFRGANDNSGRSQQREAARPAAPREGMAIPEALRTYDFYKLLLASSLYTFVAVGIIVHFVPILTERGATAMEAAGIASIIGISSLVGRLSTGLLLDHFSGRIVGALIFLLPVISCGLLLLGGANPVSHGVAAALFGFTVGAEVDVIAYVVTRRFGLKNFGVLFGAIVAAMAIGSAIGPLAAGATFDMQGNYAQFLFLTMALMLVSSLALATLKRV